MLDIWIQMLYKKILLKGFRFLSLSLSLREKWNSNVQYLDLFLHLIIYIFLNVRKNELIQIKGTKKKKKKKREIPKITLVEVIIIIIRYVN